jgi:hypothetical protein
MKKLILIISTIILTFVGVSAVAKHQPSKNDKTFVYNVLHNEGICLEDSTSYNVTYGKRMIYLSIYKEDFIRHYQMKDGYIYSITEIFSDGVRYYGPEKD